MNIKIEVLKIIVVGLIKDTLDDSINDNKTLTEVRDVDWSVYLTEQGIDLNLIDQTVIISLIAGVAYTIDRVYEG